VRLTQEDAKNSDAQVVETRERNVCVPAIYVVSDLVVLFLSRLIVLFVSSLFWPLGWLLDVHS
jgi:hypothetical protein